jgi:tape measure domain-containing protein
MTRNIGTFTAAGVDLETSTNSIKGIANLAAGSGSSAQQASVAMYQLSQAIAAGSVKLMDWNSVVNAGMGGELFQKALEKTAKELGHGRDMSVSFRESLEKGWLTTEVLTKTLNKFANDKSLIKAATQVKTFTQLLSTMKESVQSGWANSWENILGNKDEAASLFTALNDGFSAVAGASANVRNEMLKFWKENGGRENIIKGIANILLYIGKVIQPIKDAFSEIFPPMTGKRLVELSRQFKDLTDKLKIRSETTDNIKRTFKGLFSVLSIGKELFSALIKGVSSIIKYFSPTSNGILGLTANFGDFLVRLDETIKKGNIFSNTIKKIGIFIEPVGKGIKKVISGISDEFSKFDFISMNKFKQSSYNIFEPLMNFGELIKVIWSKISPILGVMWNALGNFFDDLKEKIQDLTGTDVKNFFDMMLSSGLIVVVAKFLKNTSKLTANLSDMVKKITDVFGAVKDTLKTYQNEIKANIIQKIAIAVSLLVASLIALTFVNPEKITGALVSVGTLLALVTTSLILMSKTLGDKNFTIKMSLTLISLALAVATLAKSISTIAGIETGNNKVGIIAALGSITVLLGALLSTAVIISRFKVNTGEVVRIGLGATVIATSMLIFSEAIVKLGKIQPGQLKQGGVAIAGLMTCIGMLSYMTKDVTKFLGVGLGIIAVAKALDMMIPTIQILGTMPIDQLHQGGVALTAIISFMGILAYMSKDTVKFLSVGTGMMAIGLALKMMIPTINSLASMDPGKMWTAIGGLSALMVTMGILTTMSTTGSAPALLGVAAAITALAFAIKILGSMNIDQVKIAIGGLSLTMVVLIASLTAITVVLTALLPLAPGISAFAIALLQLSGAVALAGVGVALFAVGLGVLTAVGAGAVTMLTTLFIGLASAIVAGVVALGKATPTLMGALEIIINGVLQLLQNIAQPLAETIAYLLLVTIDTLNKYSPKILDATLDLIVNILKALVSKIYDWGFEAGEAFGKAIDNMWTSSKDTFDRAKIKMEDFGILLLDGLSFGMFSRIKDLVKNVTSVGTNVLNAFKNVFDIHSPSREGYELGEYISKGLGNGIRENGTYPSFSAGVVGGNVIDSLTNGINNNTNKPVVAVKNIMKNVVKQFQTASFSSGAAGRGLTKSVSDALEGSNTNLFTAMGNALYKSTEVPKATKEPKVTYKPDKIVKDIDKLSTSSKKATDSTKQLSKEIDKAYENSANWIEEQKYYDKLSLESELSSWKRVQARYKKGTEERSKADKEVYRVQKEITEKRVKMEEELYKKGFDTSVNWIDEQKYYNKLSLSEELSAWERVQTRYKKGTEERSKADKEVYRVKKEITDNLKKLDDDYYTKQKEINDKLKTDIESTNKTYEDALKSREDSLYNSYGLFDQVGSKEPINGIDLWSNLRDQVHDMTTWREELDKLSKKGIKDDLIKELEAMGPQSVDKIKALNQLSSERLNIYVDMWKKKHELAKSESLFELSDLKTQTNQKIIELNTNAQIELDKYKNTWIEETRDLRTTVQNEFRTFMQSINEIIESQDWRSTGINLMTKIVDGFTVGSSAIKTALNTALNVQISDTTPKISPVLDLTNAMIGVKQLGTMSNNGLLNGISSRTSEKESTINPLNQNRGPIAINNTYQLNATVREEADIKKIARELDNMQKKNSRSKEVLAW